jgi:hypothetical protein
MKPFDDLVYRNNAGMLFKIGQVELMVLLAILFAGLSLVIWHIKGRGVSYFVSQFLSIACVILAVAILFEKAIAWRVTHHMLAEHHLADRNYPQLFDQTPR